MEDKKRISSHEFDEAVNLGNVYENAEYQEIVMDEDDYVKLDNEYVNDGSLDNIDVDDEKIIDSDEEYAHNYIVGRLFEATEIMTDLTDYLENSPYAKENGGDTFKKHLVKANKILSEIESFWDE